MREEFDLVKARILFHYDRDDSRQRNISTKMLCRSKNDKIRPPEQRTGCKQSQREATNRATTDNITT